MLCLSVWMLWLKVDCERLIVSVVVMKLWCL